MDASSIVHCSNFLSFNRSTSSSLACFPGQAGFVRNELKIKLKKGSCLLNPKCEIVASKAVSGEQEGMGSKSSSLSALEILKTSAADRKSFLLPFSI